MSHDIGQYKIFNEIGKGSFGKVYKGMDKLTQQEVALKFIEKKQKRSRDLKNLRQENQLLKKINHPNVICLKDVIQTPKQIIIVTDYAGRDLSGLIEQVKKFSLQKVKQYSIQILNAMVYLNDNRIIHRDLKPQNILIKDNHIKICDFGFAKKLSASTNYLQSMKGTPLYLAPQIVRQTKYTEKVDIWSFGCIIYELFTGRTPYYANTYQKLAPLILYQQVQYPKQMPADLKDLICSMLQKNPQARPNWQQLKDHSFFKQNQALKQKIDNVMKEVTSIQIPDKYYPHDKALNQNKQNNNNIHQQQQLIESKVIQKLQNENELKGYNQQFKKIYTELVANKLDSNELRKDIIFLHKIKTVLHERSQLNPLITNELLQTSFDILSHLIKFNRNHTAQNIPQNTNNEEDDITKNQALIIAILCLAKVQKNYQMLQRQLKMIGYLVKRNFNGVAINSQIDQQITQFVTEILLQNSIQLPVACIRYGLTIIGILVNQAMITINNSYPYFQRIAEDNLLSKIANIYKKQQKYAVILECLTQFIHPSRTIQNMNGSNPHHVLHSRLQKVFLTLKQQVSEALLKTQFLSQKSPLSVYSQNSQYFLMYCQVLLECLNCSAEMRKQFLKYDYWTDLFNVKKGKSFLFAYNAIILRHEDKSILRNEQIAKITLQTQQNKLINKQILSMSLRNLKKKQQKLAMNPHSMIEALKYKKSMFEKISYNLFIQQELKVKYSKEIYGALQTSTKTFDQPLIQLFYDLSNSLKFAQNCDKQYNQIVQIIQSIYKKICNTTTSFRPNTQSLFRLMNLFTDNSLFKNLRNEKNIQLFLYQCISDFIKREQFQYLENDFEEEKDIPAFIAKMIQCLNTLIDVQQLPNKNSGLSQSAINITKQIQTSCFYRFMFIDGLTEQQFYEHLKYSLKIVSKTSQVSSEFVNFLGVKVILMCKNYSQTQKQELICQMCVFLSQIARDHSQFNNQIIGTGMIRKFKQWLVEDNYSQLVKQKVLYLVGNLAKRSQFFFGQFQAYAVIESIAACLKAFYTNQKIFKNTIYSIGNISFYTQKFYKEIAPMIQYFAKAFDLTDPHLKNNLISTVSNLMRFSNVYLSQLIKTGLLTNILKMACQSNQLDQATAVLIMSLIKKILPYDEFYQSFGYKDLKIMYQKKNLFGGDTNEAIRKIKDVLMKAGQL